MAVSKPSHSSDRLALVLRGLQLILALMLTAVYAVSFEGFVDHPRHPDHGLLLAVIVIWPASMLVAVFAFIIIRSTLVSSRKNLTYRRSVLFDLAGLAFAVAVCTTAPGDIPHFCELRSDWGSCELRNVATGVGSILSLVFLVSFIVGRYIHLRDKKDAKAAFDDARSAANKTREPYGPSIENPNPHSRFREPPTERSTSNARPSEMEAGDSTWSV